MATVARENIGTLNDKITIKVVKEDYFPAFEKKIKEYSKSANVPGFRKGMVPAGLVKKMYGPAIFTEEVIRTVEKELYTYLQQENPSIFAQPLPIENTAPNLDHLKPAEYEFAFEIGLKPEFDIAALDKANITHYKVKVTEEMVDEEVNRLQIKAGTMRELESVEHADNTLTIGFTECNADGTPLENSNTKELAYSLNDFAAEVQQQFTGKKKGDNLILKLHQLSSGDKLDDMFIDLGFSKGDSDAADKSFNLTLRTIGSPEKHELNEEFYKKIFPATDISSEVEFRAKLKEEIEQYWAGRSQNQLHDQLYHYLLDQTKMDFPASFLKRWLKTGGEKPKSADEAEAEYPLFSNQLKWTLISDQIIKNNSLEVQHEEIRKALKDQVMQFG